MDDRPDGSAASPFFTVLAAEIRYKIYQMAFGGHFLHLLRQYPLHEHPEQYDSCLRSHWVNEIPEYSNEAKVEPYLIRRKNAKWFCPRLRAVRSNPKKTLMFRQEVALKTEEDLLSTAWLRTCRRAYSETVDILYGLNTFYVSYPDVLLYLPFSIPRPRLDSLAYIRLLLPCTNWFAEDTPLVDGQFVSLLPSASAPDLRDLVHAGSLGRYRRAISVLHDLPSLRRLEVELPGSVRSVVTPTAHLTGLHHPLIGTVQTGKQLEKTLFGPLDAFAPTVEREVIVYRSVYMAMRRLTQQRTRTRVTEEDSSQDGMARFWRMVPGGDGRNGYWISSYREADPRLDS